MSPAFYVLILECDTSNNSKIYCKAAVSVLKSITSKCDIGAPTYKCISIKFFRQTVLFSHNIYCDIDDPDEYVSFYPDLRDEINDLQKRLDTMYDDPVLKKHPYALHAVLVHQGHAVSGN